LFKNITLFFTSVIHPDELSLPLQCIGLLLSTGKSNKRESG